MSRNSLPAELWNNIAHYCRRHDLRSLAMISKITVNATRPVLFQKLVIQQRILHSNPALFDLLQRDDALCASVKSIKLVTHQRRETGWTSVQFVTRFIRADAIALEGWPFGDSEQEQKAFLQLMCSGQYTSFAYREVYDDEPNKFDAMGWGAITGLRRVVFESSRTLEHSSMFLRACAPSITHLTLPADMSDEHADSLYDLLITYGLRFPNLEFFEYGTMNISQHESDPHSVLGSIFLLLDYQPTVRHLRLDYEPWRGSYYTGPTGGDTLRDILPMLKIMDMPLDAMEILAYNGLKSLSTVEEVITGDWSFFGPEPPDTDIEMESTILTDLVKRMDRFLNALLELGGLAAVKRFTITVGPKLETITYSRITVGQMQMMAKILPVVEEWTGNGNGLHDATEQELVKMFQSFSPTLKTIRLRGMDVDRSAMRAIARAVPSLQRFFFENPEDMRDDEWLTFDIIRLTNNRIVFSEGSMTES